MKHFLTLQTISLCLMITACNKVSIKANDVKSKVIDTAINRPPVLDPINGETVIEGNPVTTIDLNDGGDDKDQENEVITYSCHFETTINGALDLPAQDCTALPGVASIDPDTGIFNWTPDFDSAGTYEVWFTATDGSHWDRKNVTYIITQGNRAPVLDPFSAVTGYVSGSVVSIDANDGGNDTDIDGDTLIYSCVYDTTMDGVLNGPATSCSSLPGSAILNAATGVLSWTPVLASAGSYELWFTASDGALTDSKMAAVTIVDNSIDDFNISGITGGSDSNLDARLDFVTTPVVNWSAATGATSYDVQLFEADGATQVTCGQATGVTGTSHNFSSCSLTQGNEYKVRVTARSTGGSSKVAANSLYNFRLNRAPVAVNDGRYYVQAGTSISVNVLGDNLATPAVDPDYDLDGDTLSVTGRTSGTKGTTSISGSNVVYVAPSAQSGADTFTYTISDNKGGTATGTVSIYIVNGFTWIGAVDSNWSNPGNWCSSVNAAKTSCLSGATPPVSTTKVLFADACINCNVNLDVAVDVLKFTMDSTFTGTITQNGNTIRVRDGWLQDNGSFVGGSANILVESTFIVNGGTFNSTSGVFELSRFHGCCYNPIVPFLIYDGTAFLHNNGTVKLTTTTSNGTGHNVIGMRVNAPNINFYNLILNGIDTDGHNGYDGTVFALTAGQTVTVQNKFTQQDGRLVYSKIRILGDAEFTCANVDVCSEGGGDPWDKSTELEFAASFPIVQTITSFGTATTPSIHIAGTSTVNVVSDTDELVIVGDFKQTNGVFNAPSGWIRMWSSSNNYNNANPEGFRVLGGTFNHNNFSLSLHGYNGNSSGGTPGIGTVEVPFGFTIKNFLMDHYYGNSGSFWNLGTNTFYLTGDYIHADGKISGTPTFLVDGDVVFECEGGSVCAENSTVKIVLTGNGTQKIAQEIGAGVATGLWTISKPSGSAELLTNLTLNGNGQDLDLQSGVLNLNGMNLTIKDATPGGNVLMMGPNTTINRGITPGIIDVDSIVQDPTAVIN